MNSYVASFFKVAGIGFAVLVVLAFMPSFSALLMLFVLGTTSWEGALLMLLIAGAPFGGFLFALLFSKQNQRLREAAQLAGLWVGAVAGSWTGLSTAGKI
ncbi:hypothetical protein RXV86_12670 [Alisedimentitalea sp. MJ-SS2]|uniref:hypothetical protein n=1 Tax=Aliisedimentitalea sp. MJ-SS2 TaxID=3049795 RepID=UPI00290FD690|nr:hypothetical protein [Alisedimentitalea sp. MJ-SS2]MDU8928242.1 hypothetical protein [Alisedimentitalea sp. MJ-SS2]